MNDQRKIIFGQRLEILKNSDIKNMTMSFLNELTENLESEHQNFTKSNDFKVFSNGSSQIMEMLLMTKKLKNFLKWKPKEIKIFLNFFQEKETRE